MKTLRVMPWMAFVALAGCAPTAKMVPAPGANALPAPEVGAWAVNAGVRLEVRSQAWSGTPASLPRDLTPLLVRISNNSGRPLMIRYNDFVLVGQNGQTYAALPPFSITRTVAIARPVYLEPTFGIAPYLVGYYPGWHTWETAFPAFDQPYWDHYYPYFVRLQLPTPSMLQAALPEGVVPIDGAVTGFLYFQHVPDNAGVVTLQQRLETPNGESFGDISIPFQKVSR